MSTLTVCIPTCNGERFIAAAIRSVLAQTLTGFQFIVRDDCSTDGTRDIVSGIGDPRLRLVVNEQRLGLVGNWNRCLEMARSDYVYIFHQDDVMGPENLERKVAMLDRHPEAGYVWSNMKPVDARGMSGGIQWRPRLPDHDTVFAGHAFFRKLLRWGNLVPCSSVLLRSAWLDRWGAFDGRLRYTPDLEMWLRLALHGDVAYLADPLLMVRHHDAQESKRFMGNTQEVDEVWQAFKIIFSEQRAYVPEPEPMFQAALTYLMRWSAGLSVLALARHRPEVAAGLARARTQFSEARALGLASLG